MESVAADLINYGEIHYWEDQEGPGPDYASVLEDAGIPVTGVII